MSAFDLEKDKMSVMCTKIMLLIIGTISVTRSINYWENNVMKTWKNNVFYGFRGIKYAETPVGELRFKVKSKEIQCCVYEFDF